MDKKSKPVARPRPEFIAPTETPTAGEPMYHKLPPNPKNGLVNIFHELADFVGHGKAETYIVERYGLTSPDALRSADLMDAIDALYDLVVPPVAVPPTPVEGDAA